MMARLLAEIGLDVLPLALASTARNVNRTP